MNATAKTGTTQSAFGTAGPEVLESAGALGRDALEKTMRLTAEAAVRACRRATAAGAAQLEAAQALRAKMGDGGSENLSAVSASSEAAIAGIETYLEKAIDCTRAAADAGVETAGPRHVGPDAGRGGSHGSDRFRPPRMMNLGLAQSAELARIVTDTSTRCADPLRARVEDTLRAS